MSDFGFLPCSTWDGDFLRAILDHYTKSRGAPPGKKLAWRILERGLHRGWIGIGEPMFKLAARRRLNIQDGRPLPETVCCFIYRLEARGGGLARSSDILRAWHPEAAATWRDIYGWTPIHWETLVDPAEVESPIAGACFRRAGYRSIGLTTGRGARRPAGSTHGARVWADVSPKLVPSNSSVERSMFHFEMRDTRTALPFAAVVVSMYRDN